MAPLKDSTASGHSRFELRTLIDTSRLLVESKDLDFVLNNLLLITMGKMMCSKSMILLYDKHNSTYKLAKKKGQISFALNENIQFKNQEQFKEFTSLTDADDDSLSFLPPRLQKEGIAAVYNIFTSNQHVGILALGKKANKQVTQPHEQAFIESLVMLSAAAISNSEMFLELKSTNKKLDLKLQELHTLFDLSKEFNSSSDREQIIRIFKFALMGQMFIRSFFLVMKVEDNFKLVTQTGLKNLPNSNDLKNLFDMPEDRQMVTDDIEDQFPFLADSGMEALMKIKMQGKNMAVIGVGKRAANQSYSEYDFNFLNSLGNLALMSIQKTYLLEQQIEKERMDEELRLAREIQLKLLPDSIPEIENLDISAVNISSRQVGGDYYDLLLDQSGKLHATIADVTGKGIPASLLMANMQSMMHMITPLNIDLPKAVGQINNIMYHNTPSDKFVTFFWGCFNPQDNSLTYINAGHNPPVIVRSDSKEIELLTKGGMLLGIMETITPYELGETQLNCDDVAVLFTDGVTEAMSPTDEEYGEERLEEVIKKNINLTAEGIQNAIIEDVNLFTDGKYSDDLTMIVLKGM